MISFRSLAGQVLIVEDHPRSNDLVSFHPSIRQSFQIPVHVPIALLPLGLTDFSYTHHEFLLIHPSTDQVWSAVIHDVETSARDLYRFALHSFPLFLDLYPDWEPTCVDANAEWVWTRLVDASATFRRLEWPTDENERLFFETVHLFFSCFAPFLFCVDRSCSV